MCTRCDKDRAALRDQYVAIQRLAWTFDTLLLIIFAMSLFIGVLNIVAGAISFPGSGPMVIVYRLAMVFSAIGTLLPFFWAGWTIVETRQFLPSWLAQGG